uniref:Uncharacterized protein n=1 Tax=Oryza punctata TaxID=4537 RepID=A0A0E0KCJ6_ORYPU
MREAEGAKREEEMEMAKQQRSPRPLASVTTTTTWSCTAAISLVPAIGLISYRRQRGGTLSPATNPSLPAAASHIVLVAVAGGKLSEIHDYLTQLANN